MSLDLKSSILPSNWRVLLRILPFPVAGLILYFVLREENWTEIYLAFRKARICFLVAGALIYAGGFYLSDIGFHHIVWNRLFVPIKISEVFILRAFSILLMLLFSPLGAFATAIYLYEKKNLKLLPSLSTNALLAYSDLWVIVPQVGLALFISPYLSKPFLFIFLLFSFALLITTWLFLLKQGKKSFNWLYAHPIFYSLRICPKKLYPSLVGTRLLWTISQILGHWLALKAMGINAPFSLVLVVVVFITMTTFMPISFLGFGAPNAVALVFLPYAKSSELVNAYSLSFQFFFLIIRLGLGIAFLYPFWLTVLKPYRETHKLKELDQSIYRRDG